MGTITGAQLAAEALMDLKVDRVFSLSGGHITPIYQFLQNSGIKIFDTRHEQAAVFMAEAWGRMTKRCGVAMVTAGPGFTNSLSAVANARLSNAPLVLIAGCIGMESAEKLDLQDMRQLPVIEPMVKKALVCQKPERAYEFVEMAFRIATTGRFGPVYLEMPVDVLNAEVSEETVKRPRSAVVSAPADNANALLAVDMLLSSSRPLVVAGSGAWYSGAEKELAEFITKTGVPVLTSSMGRGVISDEDPLCFGSSLAIRPGAALMANMSADLVIFLGNRMSLYYIFGDIFNKEAKIIQVDIEPAEIGRNRTVDLGIFGDVKATLAVMNRVVEEKRLSKELVAGFAPWIDQIRQWETEGKEPHIPLWESDAVPIHPMRLAKEIDSFMNREDDVVVADGGDTQVWMGMTRTVRRPGHYMDSGIYGCLGVGLPFALAAKLKNPDRRVCLITGDGSIGFNFMEFETAIRKNLPIVVVISNDLGWGMIRHSQELRLGHAIEEGTYIGHVDYHKMVEAIGGKGIFVEKPEEIGPALKEAFDSGKVTCINVMTDPTTVSPGSVALSNLGGYSAG